MAETDRQRQYREDALVLGELGSALFHGELPKVEVRLPRALAEKAVAAWERDDDEGPPDPEDFEQRAQRHRAATLAFIGLSIVNSGRLGAGDVVVELSVDLIGEAASASDDLPLRTVASGGEGVAAGLLPPVMPAPVLRISGCQAHQRRVTRALHPGGTRAVRAG